MTWFGSRKDKHLRKTQGRLVTAMTASMLVIFALFCQNCELNNNVKIPQVSCDTYYKLTSVLQGTHNDMSMFGDIVLFNHNVTTAYDMIGNKMLWQKGKMDLFAIEGVGGGFTKPYKIGDELYIVSGTAYSAPTRIAVVDIHTGAIVKRIKPSGAKFMIQGTYAFIYENKYYFTGGDRHSYDAYYGNGLYYIDLGNLTYDNGDGYWAGDPVVVKQIPRNANPMDGVRQDGHYCYMTWFAVNDDVYVKDPGERQGIAKIDLDTGLTVWENNDFDSRKIFDITNTYVFANYEDSTMSGLQSGCLGLRIYDKEDGTIVKILPNTGMSISRISFNNGLMYLATGNYPDQFPYTALMYCIDEANGNIIWQRFKAETDEPSTLGCKPQVHNGVLYIPTSHYLELCDASTGEALGRDYSIYGDGWNAGDTVKWNNIMVVSDGKGQIWGVVMNWKIVNGKLVKE